MVKAPSLSSSIIAERLARSEAFADLCQEELLAIVELCREENYDADQPLLVEGEVADKLFVLERGKVALEKKVQLGRHSTPRSATIAHIVPGQLAGFSALVAPYIYSTSARCVEPTRVIVIDGTALRTYLADHPAAGYKIMNRLSTLVRRRYRQSIGTLTYFLSVVSHELRSPLAAVENYLQVMLAGFAGDLNPKQERMVKRSILRVTDLRSQIGDIVDLARMQPEQIQSDFIWCDLSEVGTEAIEDVRLAAAEKDIQIKVEPPPAFEPVVGAPRRLRQVFTNLLNNAIRYSPEDSKIYFRAWFEPDMVYFEVEDEGPGIPAEDMPHIFKEFFRASNIEGAPGMGLGLSIAKKIINAHEGDILVRDAINGDKSGTIFTVLIPRHLQTPEMKRQKWLNES